MGFCRLTRMMGCMQRMSMGSVRVMGSFVMMSSSVVRGGFLMMLRSVLMVLRSFRMMGVSRMLVSASHDFQCERFRALATNGGSRI